VEEGEEERMLGWREGGREGKGKWRLVTAEEEGEEEEEEEEEEGGGSSGSGSCRFVVRRHEWMGEK